MGNRITLVLVLLAAAAGGFIALQPRLGLFDDAPIAPRAPSSLDTDPGAAAGDVPPVPDLADLTDTLERPLFSTDRRPAPEPEAMPVPQAQPAPVVAQPPPRLELSAVIIDTERRLALFRGGPGGGSLRASEGDTVEGWTVSAVRADGVTLKRGGESHEIALRTFKPAPAAAQAPVPQRRRARTTDGQQVQPAAAPVPRPRRPLRGPRRRSLQRQQPG